MIQVIWLSFTILSGLYWKPSLWQTAKSLKSDLRARKWLAKVVPFYDAQVEGKPIPFYRSLQFWKSELLIILPTESLKSKNVSASFYQPPLACGKPPCDGSNQSHYNPRVSANRGKQQPKGECKWECSNPRESANGHPTARIYLYAVHLSAEYVVDLWFFSMVLLCNRANKCWFSTALQLLDLAALAAESWEVAWEILHDNDDWHHDLGDDLHTGVVHSKSYKNFGRVTRFRVSKLTHNAFSVQRVEKPWPSNLYPY